MARVSDDVTPSLELLDERASAFQRSIVFMRQAYPNMAYMTFDSNEHRGANHLILAKFVVGVGEEHPVWLTYDECDDSTTCYNVPGGLFGTCHTKDGMKVETGIYPLLVGRDTEKAEGACLIKIKCHGDKKAWLKFGNGNISFMHFSPNKDMMGPEIDCEKGNAVVEDGVVVITRQERDEITCVRGNMEYERKLKGEGSYIIGKGFSNELKVVVSFSKDKDRALELSKLDPDEEFKKAQNYYEGLLSSIYIKTPNPELDEAFAHALLNVEYSYLYPYGWIESIHHWPTMWHMEHTAAEEWYGRPERTKTVLRAQMKNVFENGAIPDMCTTGKGRRDWGDNNQFFFREVEHYLKMTLDMEFAREVEPYMDRVIKQTFDEYDPTFSGIIGWGTQIGNQEDFESTPGKGAAPGSCGAEMLKTMSVVKGLLGKTEEAEKYRRLSDYVVEKMKKRIWLQDLGRYAWYEDVVGKKYLETTYHGIIYPIIYDQLDDFDMVSSIDHLEHRLTGPEGEVYQTNHFGDHAYSFVPTWGMQCGSNMQPFATKAYSKLGMADSAIKPLEFIAKRVCGEYQRGSWPETANEKRFAYFSPSAAVWAQEMIESIFGINMDLIANKTFISPCIPENWGKAELKLPNIHVIYERKDGRLAAKIKVENDTEKVFRILLPPYENIKAIVNGREVDVSTRTRCGFFEASFDMGNEKEFKVEIEYAKIPFSIKSPKNIAVGDTFDIGVSGLDILGIDDRCGIFSRVQFDRKELKVTVKDTLLDDYEKFGYFGLVNFARRVFVLKVKKDDIVFDLPVKLVLMKDVIFSARYEDGRIFVDVYNNMKKTLSGKAKLVLFFKAFDAECHVEARSMKRIVFDVDSIKKEITPGVNNARIMVGDKSADIEVFAEVRAEVKHVELDKEMIKPMNYWKEIGLFQSHGHMMQGPDNFMKDLFETVDSVEVIDGVPFRLSGGFIPVSFDKHRIVRIPLDGMKAKKVYVLFSAFIDNHNVFGVPFTVELELEKKDSFVRPVYVKELAFPGEIDMGFGNSVIAGFATYVNGTKRGTVPNMPYTTEDGDYPNSRPYIYPERDYWCKYKAVEVCNTVFNMIEIDTGKESSLKEIRFIANNADIGAGIYAINLL